MKILKHIIIFACIIFLTSCEVDDNSSLEKVDLSTSEINLIDESYAVDLESYKNIPIIFNDGQYDIKEVLTNSDLFNRYMDAEIHHLENTQNTKILYVISNDDEDKITMSKIAKMRTTNKSNMLDASSSSLVRLWQHVNYKGWRYRYYIDKTISSTSSYPQDLPSNRTRKASSMKWLAKHTDNCHSKLTLIGHNGKRKTYTLRGTKVDKELPNLGFVSDIGNDNVVKVKIQIIKDY